WREGKSQSVDVPSPATKRSFPIEAPLGLKDLAVSRDLEYWRLALGLLQQCLAPKLTRDTRNWGRCNAIQRNGGIVCDFCRRRESRCPSAQGQSGPPDARRRAGRRVVGGENRGRRESIAQKRTEGSGVGHEVHVRQDDRFSRSGGRYHRGPARGVFPEWCRTRD